MTDKLSQDNQGILLKMCEEGRVWCSVGADLVVVTLQLLVKTLVALLHLLLVPGQRGQAVQRTRVQVIGVAPHHAAQRLRLTDHLRPRLRHTHTHQGVGRSIGLTAFTEALATIQLELDILKTLM